MTSTFTIQTIAPHINWTYFFKAWKLPGRYPHIETVCECEACQLKWLAQFDVVQQPKAREALRLMRDAQALFRCMQNEDAVTIRATHRFVEARGTDTGIILNNDGEQISIPTLRQQVPNEQGHCLSLSDFVSPTADKVGLFAVSVSPKLPSTTDVYEQMLLQTVCDRLAEATSEYLHITLTQGIGIRPAVGYPSLPDQSLMFEMQKLLPLHDIGISLTENGAMLPHASVCGLYITHPKAQYFMVGQISEEQLAQYAAQRGKSVEEIKRFVG